MIARTATFTVEIDTHQRLSRLLYGANASDSVYATAVAAYVEATAIVIPWLNVEAPVARATRRV